MPKKVIALQETRLAGTLGHTCIVPARIPTTIPEPLYAIAAKSGCVDFDPKMAQAMVDAMKEAAKESSDVDIKAAGDPKSFVREAVRKVMLLGDTSTLTSSGTPKVMAVRKVLDVELAAQGVTVDVAVDREIVYDVFLELQDVRPEDAPPVSDLQPGTLGGEEAGGNVEDMLARVGPGED